MKGKLRNFFALLLTAIYGFAIGVSARSLPSDFRIQHPSAQENFVVELSAKLSHHSAQTESAVGNIVNLQAPSIKITFDGYFASLVVAAKLIKTEFKERLAFSRKALLHQWMSDILFPFHFFW